MGVFFIYSIKVALCLVAFYLLYKLLLSRDTFHTFNRFAVFAAVVVSLVIPFVEVSTVRETPVMQGIIAIEDFVVSAEIAEEGQKEMTLSQICLLIYIIGVTILFVREMVSTIGLFRLIANGEVRERRGNVQIIVMKQDIAPFSWFNYVIISEKDYVESSREIITHELAHIRLCHSVDVALCNLLIIFQWFNPTAWLLKQELQNVHEFEADEAVLKEGVDARQYQLLLIKKSVGERLFTMANNLNHNSLKKRITMMTKKKSSPWSRTKVLFMVPLTAVAIAAFANQEVKNVSQRIEAESEELVSNVIPAVVAAEQDKPIVADATEMVFTEVAVAAQDTVKTVTEEKAFDVVEQMPQFPGGMAEMMKWLSTNVRYPKEAMEADIQGRVIVQFIVEKDGSVSDAHIVKSVEPSIDAEAIRVVSAMPKWTPGRQDGETVRVKFTIPVTFRLTGDSDKKEELTEVKVQADGIQTKGISDKTLIYVNGVKIDREAMSKLVPADVASVTVLKGENAKEKYGEEAAEGVIEITTKKK